MATKKHIREIYGEHVKTAKYTTSGLRALILLIIGMTIIPLEIFLRGLLGNIENGMIINIQI
jgi:hypothetical protein